MTTTIRIFDNSTSLAGEAARFIATTLHQQLAADRTTSLVLSGGETPRRTYTELGMLPRGLQPDWNRVHIYWGDERCVPPDHRESNYLMAKESLLSVLSVPDENVHRIPAEAAPREAARLYEEEIRRSFGVTGNGIPSFGLVLLGLGEDGHTASLFPGSSALREDSGLVTSPSEEKGGHRRVTLTLAAINSARAILFLVSGQSKAGIVRGILEEGESSAPASRVRSGKGTLTWFVDREAASLLTMKEVK